MLIEAWDALGLTRREQGCKNVRESSLLHIPPQLGGIVIYYPQTI